MKTITYDDIVKFGPCYDPVKHIGKDFKGTILDLLMIETIPFADCLWLISKDDLIEDGLLRRFLAWCAAEALFVGKQTDKRSWACVETVIKKSLGLATQEDLSAARSAAESAAWSAA